MVKFIIYFLAIIFLLALNIVFPNLKSGAPNFLFLLMIIYAFRQDSSGFLWLAFFSGLMLDVYSNVFFGTYALSFLLIALIINYTTRTFFTADPSLVYIGSVIVVSNLLLVGLIYFINAIGASISDGTLPLSPHYLGNKIWIDVALNLFFAVPVYAFSVWIDKIARHFQNKQQTL